MSILVPSLRSAVVVPAWAKNELWRKARAVPSLDLRFADNKSLVDAVSGQNLITFTRASSGTYVGSDGLIKTATTDAPRFYHNPTTGESLGLLVEESRTNLLVRSEEFDNGAAWSTSSLSVTSNDTAAPNGTTTADLLTNTATTAIISQSITKAAAATTYTASVWLKSTEVINFSLTVDDGGTTNRGRCTFDITTGEILTENDEGDFTNTSATIIAYPDSWYRITVTTTTNTQTTARFRAFFSGSGDSVFIWGAQLEDGAFATSYIPATSSTVTRAADVASISGSNFSGWYRQDEGTVFSDCVSTHSATQILVNIAAVASNTGTSAIVLASNLSSSQKRVRVRDAASVDQASLALGASSPESRTRIAAAIKADDFAASLDGGAAVTDTTGTVPTVALMEIGSAPSGVNLGTQLHRRLIYWPARLPDSTLQTITQ